MSTTPREVPPSPFGLDRIVFFSDAVIAIAITLLVLDLKVPEASGETALDLGREMLGMWHKYLGYMVSFWVIALYWVAHHRCFRYIRKYDRRLIFLNFLFLMFIAFMPYPTALLFSRPTQSLVALFSANLAMYLWFLLIPVYVLRRYSETKLLSDVSR